MEKDFERERAAIPDPEMYVLHALMIRDLREVLDRHSGKRHSPASVMEDLGKVLSRYVEGRDGSIGLKGVDKTRPE
jgi:hypothetical protein